MESVAKIFLDTSEVLMVSDPLVNKEDAPRGGAVGTSGTLSRGALSMKAVDRNDPLESKFDSVQAESSANSF